MSEWQSIPPNEMCDSLHADIILEMLMEARGSARDKSAVRAAARQLEKDASTGPKEERFSQLAAAAWYDVLGGDPASAKRILAGIAPPPGDAKTSGTGGKPLPRSLKGMAIDWQLALVFAFCGMRDRAVALARTPSGLCIIAESFFDHRDRRQAEEYLRLAEAKAGPPVPADLEKGRDGNLSDWQSIIQSRVAIGDLAGALRAIESLPPDYHKADSLALVARRYFETGDHKAYREAFSRAVQSAAAVEGYSGRTDATLPVMRTAQEAKDREGFGPAAGLYAAALADGPPQFRASGYALLSEGYAAVGDAAAAARLAADSEAALTRMPAGKDKSRARLQLATAYARAGEADKAVEQVRRSKEGGLLEDWDWQTEFQAVPERWADRGEFDRALDAARRQMGAENLHYAIAYIARREAAIGRFADALKLAGKVRQKHSLLRLEILRTQAQAQARERAFSGLRKWVDSTKEPCDRAILDLAVAQHLLGLEGRGSTRMFHAG